MLTQIQVVSDPIDVASLLAEVEDPTCGAVSSFFGVVRAQNLGRQVQSVSYDAFEPLVQSVMNGVFDEARSRWCPAANIVLSHRVGNLAVGEASVAIIVSTPHRGEAFKICRFVIEELKHRAPIWKKEFYEDGESEWLKGHALCGHAADDDHESVGHRHTDAGNSSVLPSDPIHHEVIR